MKTMSLMSFVFALHLAFVSHASIRMTLQGQDWYYDMSNNCRPVAPEQCDNIGDVVCRYNPPGFQGYCDVYSDKIEGMCFTVTTHSENAGKLN